LVTKKQAIQSADAPQAIGTYSQAVQLGSTIYLSGQIGLDPSTMQLAEGFEAQAQQVFSNLKAVAKAAGATLDDAVKINVFLTDFGNFSRLNEIMGLHFKPPYPARAAVGVSQLPRGALVEIDAILQLP
jgi:reactive intermediate/imine deaminase